MTDPRQCPDCQGRIALDATHCRCGWKHPTVALQDAEAAARSEAHQRAEAERAAQRRVEAAEYMRANGLKDAEDCVALARSTVRSLTHTGIQPAAHWRRVLENPKACYVAKEMAKVALAKIEGRPLEREPGCDDEEVPA